MKLQLNKTTLGTLFLMVLGFLFFTGEVVQGTTSLPPNLIIGDTEGFYVDEKGEYFIHMEDIMPGDVFTKEIVIRNVDKKEGFDVRIQVRNGESSGPIDFRKVVEVELTLDGKPIYKGGILGNDEFDWTKDQLELGHYSSGDEQLLQATFTVSSELGLEDYQKPSEYEFYWNFIAKEGTGTIPSTSDSSTNSSDDSSASGSQDSSTSDTSTSSSDGSGSTTTSSSYAGPGNKKPSKFLPQTGEEWENLLYRVCAGLFISVIIVLIIGKKRQQRKDDIK